MAIRFLYLTIFFTLVLSFVIVPPVLAQGDFGLTETAESAGLGAYPKDVSVIAGNAIGTALSLIAVLFFGLMIYGGFRWMLSRGEEDEAKKALDTIFAAIIGMIVVLAAYAITNFVFGAVGKAKPTNTTPEDTTYSLYCVSDGCDGKSGSTGDSSADCFNTKAQCVTAKEQVTTFYCGSNNCTATSMSGADAAKNSTCFDTQPKCTSAVEESIFYCQSNGCTGTSMSFEDGIKELDCYTIEEECLGIL